MEARIVRSAPVEADREYLRRTADRIRAMTASSEDMSKQDPEEVRERLERMSYGGSRHRNQTATLP